MFSTARFIGAGWLLCPLVGLWLCPIARGQSPPVRAEEVREYEILVKGKPAGSATTRITDTNDGLTAVSTDAAVAIDFVVYTYRYEFHGREVWRGNRLTSVDVRAVDGNAQFATRARIDMQGSTIEIPGKRPQAGPALAMTTNYWHAPPASKGNAFALLDADQGAVHAGRIEDVASEQLLLAGRKIDCTHYRLGGDLPADLWFDDQDRIVRQKSLEQGHWMELRLKQIQIVKDEK